MSFYAVINLFEDELDGNRLYKVGDLYPRAGLVPTVERIKELMGKNKYGKIFIQKYTVGTGEAGAPKPINLERDMAIARNVHDTVDDRILHDMTNMRNWFDGTIASKDEVDRVTAQLAQKTDKGNVSARDINKNLGKFDQTYMTDEFIQQMAGDASINAVPADKSITEQKLADKSVSSRAVDTNSLFVHHLADKPSASILIQDGAIDYNTATKALDFSVGSYFITYQGTYFNATTLLSGKSIPFGEGLHTMIYWNTTTKTIETKIAVMDIQTGLQRQLALMGFIAHADPLNALFNFDYTVDGLRPHTVKNGQWYRKKINLLGDSITFGGTWVGPLSKLTGAALTNYGVNGSALMRRSTRTDSFNERYPAMTNDAELIIVWGGVNDHHWPQANNSFGEPDSVDVNTFYGALNSLITGLIAKYPTKKIAFITPMKNWGYTGASNWNATNSKGKTLTDHRNAIIERCNYYSVPVLDLFNDSNIAPVTSQHKTAFMPDGLHPNDAGGKRIATMIFDFINGL